MALKVTVVVAVGLALALHAITASARCVLVTEGEHQGMYRGDDRVIEGISYATYWDDDSTKCGAIVQQMQEWKDLNQLSLALGLDKETPDEGHSDEFASAAL